MLNKKLLSAVAVLGAVAVTSSASAAGDRDFNTAACAVIGAAIGSQNGGSGGAVVGGLVGAAVGNSLGGGHGRGYVSTRVYAPAPVYYEQPAPVYYQPAPVYYEPAPRYYYRSRHGRSMSSVRWWSNMTAAMGAATTVAMATTATAIDRLA